MFENFSKDVVDTAVANIYKHIYRDFNIKGQLSSGQGADEMPKDLKGTLFYQAIFDSEVWNECDLTDASGNGTIFRDNDFYNSKINNVSMQYCSFTKDIFHNCSFIGSNFANSTFTYCAIQDSEIYGCSFLGAEFYSGILRNTRISSSNFELCHFRKILIEDIDLRQLTLNYAFFEDVYMKNVCLPFIQIPYTFNGLQYVFNTLDNIKISSHNSSINTIELAEYKEMIQDFIIFFNDKNQYFPLTNCYFVQDKLELAAMCNETGIRKSAALHDFRSLYFYCIQASQILKISREKRVLLYSEINTILSTTHLTVGEYHQFYLYFPMIKKLLFDIPNDNPVMTLTIHTNIDPNDYDKLSILLNALEKATNESGITLDSKHIEIRHNSPNVIDFFSSGQFYELISNVQSIFYVLRPIIADLASIITIGGAIGATGKFISNKANKKIANTRKKQALADIVKLRKELNKLLLNNEESYGQSPSFSINIENTFLDKLASTKETLKTSGIFITSLEIQFLDGKEDPLDTLYNQNIFLPTLER